MDRSCRSAAPSRHPSFDERDDPAVPIVHPDPRWPDLDAAELRRAGDTLGAVAAGAEHIGSTAVPGLAA